MTPGEEETETGAETESVTEEETDPGHETETGGREAEAAAETGEEIVAEIGEEVAAEIGREARDPEAETGAEIVIVDVRDERSARLRVTGSRSRRSLQTMATMISMRTKECMSNKRRWRMKQELRMVVKIMVNMENIDQ